MKGTNVDIQFQRLSFLGAAEESRHYVHDLQEFTKTF